MEQLLKIVTEQPVDCGKAIVTEYYDTRGKQVRRDTNIVVDPAKMPKLGLKVNF